MPRMLITSVIRLKAGFAFAGDLDPISMKPLATDNALQAITNTGSPRALPEGQKLSSGQSLPPKHSLSRTRNCRSQQQQRHLQKYYQSTSKAHANLL